MNKRFKTAWLITSVVVGLAATLHGITVIKQGFELNDSVLKMTAFLWIVMGIIVVFSYEIIKRIDKVDKLNKED